MTGGRGCGSLPQRPFLVARAARVACAAMREPRRPKEISMTVELNNEAAVLRSGPCARHVRPPGQGGTR